MPEISRFFGIVIQIQQQAGGNLSEALGNLSRVLRDRKKMKAKIQALSMEAKASAVIIGALPFIVAVMVYITSPNYIMPLFTTSTTLLVLLGAYPSPASAADTASVWLPTPTTESGVANV